MAAWESVAVALYTGTALLLAAVAWRSWWHARGPRTLFLATAFLLIVAKGLLFTIGVFSSNSWRKDLVVPGVWLDVAALGLLYAGVLRRP